MRLLLDRGYEVMLAALPEGLVTACFGGTKVLQKIEKVPLHSTSKDTPSGMSTQDDCPPLKWCAEVPLTYFSLPVSAGVSNLYQSLAASTNFQLLEGTNQWKWPDQISRDTYHREIIGAPPNLLVLGLRRYCISRQTFTLEKMDSYLSFPHELYLKPFTLDGTNGLDSRNDLDDLRFGVKPSAGMDVPCHCISPDQQDANYVYTLGGVVCHKGTSAASGHFYSLIRDRKTQQWFRFDDEIVTEFDSRNLEQECFGQQSEKDSACCSCALILVYDKFKC